jgi:hypothetical protein
MQRRRGLVSQPAPTDSTHAQRVLADKRARASSESSYESDSTESKANSSCIEENITAADLEEDKISTHAFHGEVVTEAGTAKDASSSTPQKKKNRRDFTDETRWQKMKVVGSEKEVMVDLTRVQKYVDYDSTTVQSFESEVKSAKGNFRQQAMADYSDL